MIGHWRQVSPNGRDTVRRGRVILIGDAVPGLIGRVAALVSQAGQRTLRLLDVPNSVERAEAVAAGVEAPPE